MRPLGEDDPRDDGSPMAAKREKKPENVAAGQRVKRRREELGMTQTKLGQKIGMDSTAKHEQGVFGFSGKTLTALASALDVSERWILHGEEPAATESTVEEPWTDWPAWIALELSGRIDYYRGSGVPEAQLEQIRRTLFRGPPEEADYELMLQGALRNALRHEHPTAAAAREEHEREGGPDLSGMLRKRSR